MDTQALTTKASGNPLTTPNRPPSSYAPRPCEALTIFTETERAELKAIIKECLKEFHHTNY